MRSFEVSAFLVTGLACLAGCGGATPAPATPTQDTAVVNLDAGAPGAAKPKAEDGPIARYAIKGPEDNPDPHAARAAALRDAAEFGARGLLNDLSVQDLTDIMMGTGGISGGVTGGVAGVLGGTGGGILGGHGLSGAGQGGGGTGIGLGSLGTVGRGSGSGSGFGYGYGYGSGSSSGNPVSGDSVLASPTGVVELGDSLTLGVSGEQAARALRDRIYALRSCYAERPAGLPVQAGRVALRLVVGRDGRVVSSREIGSDFTDAAFLQCVAKAPRDAYLGIPAGGLFGVVETVVRFGPPLKK